MDFMNDSMMEILQTMDSQTKAFCADSLKPAYFRELLGHLNIAVREDTHADKMKEALFLSAIYMEKFESYELADVVVFFDDLNVINIVTKDKRVSLYEINSQYPCSVCHFNVDDEGERGQGLECSICESWFHNSCTDSPLEDEFYNSLTDSPNFIKICCPPCLKNGQVKKLQKQISQVHTDFREDLSEVKQLINSPEFQCSNSQEPRYPDNLTTVIENLKDEFKHAINTQIVGLKNTIQADLRFISDKIDSQIGSATSITAELCSMNTKVMCIKTTLENVDSQFSSNDVVSSIVQIKKMAETTTDSLRSIDFKETAAEYKETVQELKVNTEELALTVNSNMTNLCQSTENALERIGCIDKIDINGLSTSLNTLDNVCRDQITQTSSLTEALKDVSGMVNGSIITEHVVSQLATMISKEIIQDQQNNEPIPRTKTYSSAAAESSLRPFPTTRVSERNHELSTNSSVPSSSSLSPSSSSLPYSSSAPNVSPPKLMDESKTISIGNIKDKDLVVSSAKIKSQFNKCFPRMEIVHCKKSMNGFVLIEVDTPENAKQVVMKWEGTKYFNTAMDKDNPTEAFLLEDVRAKAVIEDVDKDLSDEEMTTSIQTQFPRAKARRFINKYGPTHCVLITFNSKEDLERAKNSRIHISDITFRVRPYEARKTLVQCYNCYGFRHIAAHCRKKTTCPYCGQNHAEADCLIKKDMLTDQYKCINCKGNHTAIDKNCDQYKLMQQSISQSSNDRKK